MGDNTFKACSASRGEGEVGPPGRGGSIEVGLRSYTVGAVHRGVPRPKPETKFSTAALSARRIGRSRKPEQTQTRGVGNAKIV